MKELETRLENIYKGIEKFLSLHGELQNTTNKLMAENQELNKKLSVLEQQIKKAGKDSETTPAAKNNNNKQNNQEINKKIDELLSEVEQCITLLKK